MVCGHDRLVRLLSICFTPRETMQTRGEELGAPVLLVTPSVQHQVFVKFGNDLASFLQPAVTHPTTNPAPHGPYFGDRTRTIHV